MSRGGELDSGFHENVKIPWVIGALLIKSQLFTFLYIYQLRVITCKLIKVKLSVASFRRSVSHGAVQKTAREKIKKARREEASEITD